MSLSKKENLSGWGLSPVAECVSFRPEKLRDLHHILKTHSAPVLARGMGRSYGDAALEPTGVIRTERFDHIISFDANQGILHAQAGVTLADIMEFAIPKGWIPPALPGTRFVTLGGAFACNVHGKNHFRDGDFAEHVASIRLMLASGESVECSPEQHSDIFWATAGGMGMTGIIEEVTLRLKPIESASLKTLTYRVNSTDDMVAAFEHYRDDADYMVGWIDHMAKGGEIGRGVFEAAYHISPTAGGKAYGEFKPLTVKRNVPVFMPPFLLNKYVMAIYNARRFKKYSNDRVSEIVDFNSFFHPLDSIGNWNKLYGKRGFFQYQCLIPETPDIGRRIQALLSFLHKQKLFSFLAVLKYHRDGKGLLTFPTRGYSLALDFPNTPHVRSMMPQLDRWVAENGGRIYLAKDAQLSAEHFYQMYGAAAHEWRELIHDLDTGGRFSSLMAQRLQWKTGS